MGGGAGGKRFSAGLGYSLAEAGEDYYEAYDLNLSWAVTRKLLLKCSVPYRSIDGHRLDALGVPVRGYAQSGVGDVSVFAWYNLFTSGNASESEPGKAEDTGDESEDKKSEPYWRLMAGLGVKLDTGESDATEIGEYVPAYYQVGSGTTDYLLGVSLEKCWGDSTTYGQAIYQYVPGRNDIEYRRACRIYLDAGQKFTLHKPTGTQFKIGLSDSYLVDDNWDGLDNSGTLAGPRVGTVKGTKGHYLYGVTGLEVSPWKSLTLEAGLRLPLGSDDESSEQALDYIISLAITFKF